MGQSIQMACNISEREEFEMSLRFTRTASTNTMTDLTAVSGIV